MEVVMASLQTLWCCGVLLLILLQNLVGRNIVGVWTSMYVVLVMGVLLLEAVPIPMLLAVTILMAVVAGVTRIQGQPLRARLVPDVEAVGVAVKRATAPVLKASLRLIHIQEQQQAVLLLRVLLMLLVVGHREDIQTQQRLFLCGV